MSDPVRVGSVSAKRSTVPRPEPMPNISPARIPTAPADMMGKAANSRSFFKTDQLILMSSHVRPIVSNMGTPALTCVWVKDSSSVGCLAKKVVAGVSACWRGTQSPCSNPVRRWQSYGRVRIEGEWPEPGLPPSL